MEVPSAGRASITDLGNELQISIPSKKNVFIILFLLAWSCGWFFGEKEVITTLLNPETANKNSGFLIVWLIGWTIGGMAVFGTILWLLFGREIISLSHSRIKIERSVWGIGWKKEYDFSQAKNFRNAPDMNISPFGFRQKNPIIGSPKIAFDYGMRTIRFACDVDEAEGAHLLDRIRKRFSLKD